MSLFDKLSGRVKKAAADIAGDAELHRRGTLEERKGEAKDEAARAAEQADEKAREVADLERKTR
jgi:uncharacterized protein YjbJ (UPF0337 family)